MRAFLPPFRLSAAAPLARRALALLAPLAVAALAACADRPAPLAPERAPERAPSAAPRLLLAAAADAFVQVSAGRYHTCALRSDGAVECWGADSHGQTPATRTAPPGLSFTAVSAGRNHTCALRGDGVAECWGYSLYGQAPATRASLNGRPFTAVSAGDSHTCALRDDSVAECWGSNEFGQAPTTRTAAGGSGFTAVSAGDQHTCALRDDGVVECWGYHSSYGEAPPTRAAPNGLRYTQLEVGRRHTCAVRSDGVVECWGYAPSDQAPATRAAADGRRFTAVSPGAQHTCALRDDGAAECWGDDYFGQAPATRTAAGGSGFTAMTGGLVHTCALRRDGAVECWGGNANAQAPALRLPTPLPNRAPVAHAGGPYATTEGAAIILTAIASADAETPAAGLGFAWTVAPVSGAEGTCTVAGAATAAPSVTCTDDGAYAATLTVTDAGGLTHAASATITVANAAPAITSFTAPSVPLALVGGSASAPLVLGLTDQGTGPNETFAASTTACDGGTAGPLAVSGTGAARTVTGACTFTAAGVYSVSVTVRDDDGGTVTTATALVVVYDPSAGFVTGGGWIASPAGAYAADRALTGRATFGFVSRYQKGADVPTGRTEFQFHTAAFHFASTEYQWLVVAGAKAQYKGTGTVNGQPGYGFLLTATDGDRASGGGADRFRLKVWDTATGAVVYDNVAGGSDDLDAAPAQALGGGSIVIHARP